MNDSMCIRFFFLALAFFCSGVHAQEIKKCMSGKKIVYTNFECPSDFVRSHVDLVDGASIKGPSRDLVNQTLTRSAIERAIAEAAPAPKIGVISPVSKRQCDQTSARLSELDSESRMPISGQRQDWIRAERRKLIDWQNAQKC